MARYIVKVGGYALDHDYDLPDFFVEAESLEEAWTKAQAKLDAEHYGDGFQFGARIENVTCVGQDRVERE